LRQLIVSPSWLGDAVMMGALVQRLKTADPAGSITVMAPPHLEPLVRRLPGVDATVANPFAHGALELAARFRLGRSLRGRFDAAYVLPHSWKSALAPFFAGIPKRVGFVGEGRYGLLSDARRLDEEALPRMVDRFCALAAPVDAAAASPAPGLSVDPDAAAATGRRLGLADAPAVALCVGAEYGPAKRWPPRHFAELAGRLAAAGVRAWVLGGPADVAVGAEVADLARGAAVDLTGRTSLVEAAELLSLARAVVTNDSGLMHMAAALGRPLVALYGSSSPAFTPPLDDRAVILREALDCSPCFERVCPLGHFKCLNELSPDRVWQALAPMLAA
jgi:heptosyltransferase-2